jgi:hypothetical protein
MRVLTFANGIGAARFAAAAMMRGPILPGDGFGVMVIVAPNARIGYIYQCHWTSLPGRERKLPPGFSLQSWRRESRSRAQAAAWNPLGLRLLRSLARAHRRSSSCV